MKLYRIIYEKSNRYYSLFFYAKNDDKAYGKALDLSRKYDLCERSLHELNGEEMRRIA